MFDLYLNCGNEGRPIGRELLEELLELGFRGIREDIPDDHQAAENVLRELAEMPHMPVILLIAGGHMSRKHPRPGGPPWKHAELVAHVEDTCVKLRDLGFFARPERELPAIEPGNEPDLAKPYWHKRPAELARAFSDCYDVIRSFSPKCPVLTPSVSNLNARGFDYLERMLQAGIPAGAELAVHRYPHGTDPLTPHEGFSSRGEEVSKLLQLAGDRRIWVTETGMREGPHGKKDEYLKEDEVADAFEKEVLFWRRVPRMAGLNWYGCNDGPDRKNEYHTYGVRRLDGEWKSVAKRVADVVRKLEGAPA